MRNPAPYVSIANQIRHVINELDQANELLKHPDSGPRKHKRGAIDIIGNVANALFGVLDSKYAEEMSETITEIHQNENHIVALMRNQTSIMDTTINVMKRDHKAIETELQRVDSYLNRISAQIDGIYDERHDEMLNQRMSALTFQTLLTITNFQRSQNLILDALASTQQGKLSRYLISPNQLKDALKTIKGNLPSILKLPVNQDDIIKCYNMISLEGTMTSKHIIFKLRLPLISSEDYELFRIIPVPMRKNNIFIAIKPSFPFLIINLFRQNYYPMRESELKTCTSIEGKYFCKQRHPLYKIGSNVSACEVRLLNRMKPNSFCQLTKPEYQPTWIQLHNPNQWIYSLQEETTVNIVCGENITQLVLNDAGILKINSECIIKQPLITIHGHNVYPTINRLSYVPSLNLTDIFASYNMTSSVQYHHQYSVNISELNAIKQQLQDIIQDMDLPNTIQRHSTHHYVLGYVSLIIICGIIVVMICKPKFTCYSLPPQSSNSVKNVNYHHEHNNPEGKFEVDICT